jgi:Tol biopolymer transport system component
MHMRALCGFLVTLATVSTAASLVAVVSTSGAKTASASVRRVSISNSLGDVYSVSVDGGRLRKLTPPGRIDSLALGAVSPVGRRIAFATISRARVNDAGLRTVLAVMNIDGSNVRGVTPQLFQPRDVSWSRDGRRLAFRAGTFRPPFTEHLYVADLATGRVRRLAGTEHVIGSEWSRDGRLAFTRVSVFGRSTAVVLGSDGRKLWETPGSFVAWSPDGALLLVIREQTMLVMDRGGRRRASFRVAPDTLPPTLSWAPAGQKIVFTRGNDVWVVSPRDPRPRRLGAGSEPRWSPDGRQLAYLAPGGAGVVVAAPGGHPRLVIAVPGAQPLDWVSRNRLLVWLQGRDPGRPQRYAVVRLGGGEPMVLASFPFQHQILAQLSPDRQTVVFFHAYR